ncbi:eCIS core domain-containing protein [Mucilaginibacter sp. SP1R1]|uniref:eCIS core domain-containing protein n=1 Tax=Mucilaginibacter sp. SP1R1 TaxID=2723091 RepID=UPI00160955EB|nr:DUF4157 domain-containing protein [Mucilaginibacter sp. SP1R1]MBB6151385.1 hypothetical protein [Mucilaginibacter sp. SP1R1]
MLTAKQSQPEGAGKIPGAMPFFMKQPVQAKLEVNEPGDRYEQEADSMADRVMRMTMPLANDQAFFKPAQTGLQRKCQHCEEEEKLQRKENTDTETHGTKELDNYVGSLGASGQALPESSRQFFEPRFGQNFSNVRIHTDSVAAKSAQSINALAYTTGSNIVFNSGQYSPDSESGKRLIAHELTHVVQQGGSSEGIQRLIRTPYPWRGIITSPIGAQLRSSPNSTDASNIIGSIALGRTVNVIANSANFLQVESQQGASLVTGYVFHTLIDDAASHAMQDTVGTTMVWRGSGPHSGTDFQLWASAATETPFPAVTSTTVMNCWEAVLLSAYRSGALPWSSIHRIYVSLPTADWVGAMSRGTLNTYRIPGPSTPPQRGDIVFFNGIAHVALATGTGSQVYTFWPPPNTPFTAGGTTDRVKVYTIEDLVTWWTAHMGSTPVVQFATPAW